MNGLIGALAVFLGLLGAASVIAANGYSAAKRAQAAALDSLADLRRAQAATERMGQR